ncbi:uncharacterized protein OCT59_006133 [Rhizophagus irregularis]|uniref:uncharacterized protein n=1 Tax=Rhizophagus irregularis TaxID=588596 RepID=UPI003316B6D2|nr:hypothetical protein OCT59_006133 [Rhizophagus irregularis]
MEKMELVNVNDNSFDPTPKLKSSPIPILFVSFNEKDDNCFHCGEKYVELSFCRKKYCKKCFSHYITYIDDINTYLDVYFTMNIKCSEHETSNLKKSQNIQEYCRNFLDILYFKQIPTEYLINYDFDFYYGSFNNKLYVNVIESVNYCKLCKKSLYQGTDTIVMHSFKLCSDCYLISSEWIESTLTKKPIPITYLPWWDNTSCCGVCNSKLKIISECQKCCIKCLTVYIGCRYCLTTNIIFGLTNQSKCKKCKRVSSIILDIMCINTGNSYLDDFILNLRLNISNSIKIAEFTNRITNFNKYFLPVSMHIPVNQLGEIFKNRHLEWIPYYQFVNVKEIAKGGFGVIYKATCLNGKIVILKRFKNSKNISRYFLNELKSNYQCGCPSIIKTYGNLWIKKLDILHEISYGLKNIHETNFIHRDFHSGNILRAEIYQTFEDWRNNNVNRVQFHLAEIKRVELMKSKKLGPKFTEKHSKAIYTNYASKDQELDIDIDIESNSSSEFINSSRNELNIETFYSNKETC